MAKPNNKSQVFVRTFVAGTIALAVVSAPSGIMADEVVSTPVVDEVTTVTDDAAVDKTEDAKETSEVKDSNSQDSETSADENADASASEKPAEETTDVASPEATEDKKEAVEEPQAPITNERQMDEASLKEIISGTRTFDNGTLDLRLFNKTNSLEIGRDTDGDGLLDEAEIVVYERGNAKHFRYVTDPLKADSDGDGLIDSVDKNPLSWDFSARDAYIFSKLSYREDDELNKIFTYDQDTVEEAFELLDPKNKDNVPEVISVKLGNNTMVAAQRELARYWRPVLTIHEDSGLDAVLFEFKSDIYPYLEHKSNYVMAFRGTDGSGDGDISADGLLGLGMFTNQGTGVMTAADELLNKKGRFSDFDIKSLNVTGHSLGGYLSQVFLADMQGANAGKFKTPLHNSDIVKDVYTFNAAPIIKRRFSSQLVYDLKDAGDKLNEAHRYDKDNPDAHPVHRHFVIDGEAITFASGGNKYMEKVGAIQSEQEGDNPGSKQAHYLSNFAREQYAPIFDQGIRQGFNEKHILPLAMIDDYTEEDFIGKVKPHSLVIKNSDGNVMMEKLLTLKGFNKEIERLNNTGRYNAEVGPQGAVYTLKETPVYKIIDSDGKADTDLVYTVGNDYQGVFVSDGPATLFTGVELDGRQLPASKYTFEHGSTIVKIDKETMDALPNGEHVLAMKYTDGGKAETVFTVEGHITTADGSTQTENPTAEAGAQTDNPTTTENGVQTDEKPVAETGAQTENPTAEAGAQTDNPTTTENGAQTDEKPVVETGAQTENPTAEAGAQTENPTTTENGAQTENPTAEAGAQTENPTAEAGAQTENPTTAENGVQTENPTTTENGAQVVVEPGIAENGNKTEIKPIVDAGAQTENPAVQTGTQKDENDKKGSLSGAIEDNTSSNGAASVTNPTNEAAATVKPVGEKQGEKKAYEPKHMKSDAKVKKSEAKIPATSDVSGFIPGMVALLGSAFAFANRKND